MTKYRKFNDGKENVSIMVEDKNYIGLYGSGKKIDFKDKKDADDFANMLMFFGFIEE